MRHRGGLLVFGGLLTLYLGHVWSYTFLNDDAYISFRYALHWAEHGEVSYNLGDRVEGYTNFLWVALLALVKWWGGDIPTASLILGPLFGLFTLCYLTGFTYSSRSRAAAGWSGIGSGLLLVLSPSFTCWSSGGLEVQLFTFLMTIGVLQSALAWQHRDQLDQGVRDALGEDLHPREGFKKGTIAGITLGAAAMTRPEGVMIYGLIGGYRLIDLLRRKQRMSGVEWGGLCGFCLLYIPYFLWRYQYYGFLFPNTYYVKAGAEALWRPGAHYLLSWLMAHPWLVLLVPLGTISIFRSEDQRASWLPSRHIVNVSLLCLISMLLHVVRVGGDFMALHRFLVPLLPLSALLVMPLGLAIIRRFQLITSTLLARGMTILCIVLLCLSAHRQFQQANRIGSSRGVDSIGWLRQFSAQCAEVGKYLAEHTPREVKLATTAAGALPYYAERYTIDLLGLNDEWIAHHVPVRGHRPGHTKSAPFSYPIKKGADYLIYHPTFSQAPRNANRRYARALEPLGYRWQSVQVPDLSPPWWSTWVKQTSKRQHTHQP